MRDIESIQRGMGFMSPFDLQVTVTFEGLLLA